MKSRFALTAIWLLYVVAAVVGLLWMAVAILAGSRRAWPIAISFDHVGNASAGGDESETISARCWRYRNEQPYRVLRPLIDWAFALAGDLNHCESAYNIERVKALLRSRR